MSAEIQNVGDQYKYAKELSAEEKRVRDDWGHPWVYSPS